VRTQVGIVGAGPAGLLLGRLLERAGIESVIVESRSRAEIESAIRAGVLEHGTAELLREAGAGERMMREGFVHEGILLRARGRTQRIDFAALTGKAITLYPQHEVIKDLVALRVASGRPIFFSARVARIEPGSERPSIHVDADGAAARVECDFIAGCDGGHGVTRAAMPSSGLQVFERTYPFAWLGILCAAPRLSHELIYALHSRGFALLSTRSPTVQRMYLQCDPSDRVEDWPDERIWAELDTRLASTDGPSFAPGPILDRAVIAMRSVVTEPMQHGRLFLAGDAAHVVPPTGAKGLNLAAADVRVLALALAEHYRGRPEALAAYSATCLRRVWKAQRFSWWMTAMLHRFPGNDAFQLRVQEAELDYLEHSEAARATFAENYVGLPWED
jgi:p-hydroxybenzoate 3-monooxygenase